VVVGFSVSLYELVVGGADAPEGLDQQNDDVGRGFSVTCRNPQVPGPDARMIKNMTR
jgi:hypothetical protein